MRNRPLLCAAILACSLLLCFTAAHAQGTVANYERANGLREKIQGLALNIPERVNWITGTDRFWYRKTVAGGREFVLVDAATAEKKPAFDHGRLAASLSQAAGEKYTAVTLPFSEISFADKESAVEFVAAESRWKVDLSDYTCKKVGSAPSREQRSVAVARPPSRAVPAESSDPPKTSPDGQWQAFIRNYNLLLRSKEKGAEAFALSYDGSEDNYYSFQSITWSADSKRIAVYRIRPGYRRTIHYVLSSPLDQLQPKHSELEYAKPGDLLDLQQPVLFDVEKRKAIAVSNTLSPNPYRLSEPVWRKDSRAFTFECNQRGHQVYRVMEVDGITGEARAVIDEQASTFFCYSCKKFRHDLHDGREIIWMSERDGWNHLYLYDGASGKVKNQITKGKWVVRGVDKVDEENRQIWFTASGMYPGKDPYFLHYYRINFDGTGLTPLTDGDGNHSVVFSPDRKYYVDTWSRVDFPQVSELRRTEDRKTLAVLERGDMRELLKEGWRPPEVFTSLGRDGKSEIWGIIIRPTDFDLSRKYPVIENIYAGPQGAFVPKSFSAFSPMQALAELGFIVVQIDGMGTNYRSKAFHDVAWRNLGDAGFPDRILWHKAVAAKYPYYDIGCVGIYGHSAGGQNALGALLFHGDFYKVAVSSCGCHDNRMDKIWWNEQWMGWPLGPHYAMCSNVDNAHKLKGKLLLSVGEMDTNVDPASTMQVVNALIKANKVFDLLVLPGQGHSAGGLYGERKRYDFLVRHLLGVEPPDWNVVSMKPAPALSQTEP